MARQGLSLQTMLTLFKTCTIDSSSCKQPLCFIPHFSIFLADFILYIFFLIN